MDLQQKVQKILDRAVEAGTECGCQAALFINGKLEVNAYAGYTDWSRSRQINQDTLFPIFSTGKAPLSTLIHRLVRRGILSYDTRIADLWPEYACRGKEDTQLWQMLAYRMSMDYACDAEYAGGDALDWGKMTARLASLPPRYPVGTRQAYHAWTYGWLLGEVARRATGRELPELFRQEVAEPAGMDRFFYGIEETEDNTATLVSSMTHGSYDPPAQERLNQAAYRRCCNPSCCAMSNALSIARHYNALDQGVLIDPMDLEKILQPCRAADDPMSLVQGSWEIFGLGYALSGPVHVLTGIFGHGGAGGSEGLLDWRDHYAIGFTRNCFTDPNIRGDFYDAFHFRNRDWPATGAIPEQEK